MATSAAAAQIRAKTPTLTLSNGVKMPQLGLGTWTSMDKGAGQAAAEALRAGYSHIDGASLYSNEDEIGAALKPLWHGDDAVLKRDEFFYTSKLWNTDHGKDQVRPAFDKTLSQLGLQYLDLYLVHWPVAFKAGTSAFPGFDRGVDESITIKETWTEMEKLVETGKVKAIGVSNFDVSQLKDLLSYAKVKPVVNQVELHPYNPQWELLEFCREHDIVLTAYSPLGQPGASASSDERPMLLEDPVIKQIADKHGRSAAHVLIRWALQRGTAVIPKSVTPERIRGNLDVLEFQLSQEDMDAIKGIGTRYRFVVPGFMKHWKH